MPRLSIIIPHRNNDQRLEETLVSVLENRPDNCEILVAHDGSYRDDYDLSGEVVFVETNRGSNVLRKINEATLASCSPIVHVVFDGVTVSDQWCESALEYFLKPQVSAVSPVFEMEDPSRDLIAGLNTFASIGNRIVVRQALPSNLPQLCSGPILACGFYRRKVLLSLNGWLETVDSTVADVDLALALQRLGRTCCIDAHSQVTAPQSLIDSRLNPAAVRQLATFAVAYQQTAAGFGAAVKGCLQQLLHGNLFPSSWVNAIAWGCGILDGRSAARLKNRLQSAANRLSISESTKAEQSSRVLESPVLQKAHSRHELLRRAA